MAPRASKLIAMGAEAGTKLCFDVIEHGR